MDFESTLESKELNSSLQSRHRQLAELCPNYSFSETNRPTIDQLCHFLEKAKKIRLKRDTDSIKFTKLFSIVKYDWYVREDKSNYFRVIANLLSNLNPQASCMVDKIDEQISSITIKSPSSLNTSVTAYKLKYSLAPYLQIERLNIDLQTLDLFQFNNATVQELDLSKVKNLKISKITYIKNLKKVYISSMISPNEIKKTLLSNAPYLIFHKD